MTLSCSICFGKLVQPPDQDEALEDCGRCISDVKISAGKCGHFFHDYCIRGWLNHLRSQGFPKECPTCRTGIGKLKKLYPSFCNVSRAASVVPDIEVSPKPDPDPHQTSTDFSPTSPAASITNAPTAPRKQLSCFQRHSIVIGCVLFNDQNRRLVDQFGYPSVLNSTIQEMLDNPRARLFEFEEHWGEFEDYRFLRIYIQEIPKFEYKGAAKINLSQALLLKALIRGMAGNPMVRLFSEQNLTGNFEDRIFGQNKHPNKDYRECYPISTLVES
ncbi:unnamed protein product [Allacma fusca]|uniref:RING-type domain-containing protein n=1 Tax=Allacma fusca TaxID=39272 RepID=A0A8J2PG12_9HEXA|nr:unnamed protein product [Allacma fusca]